MEMDTHRQPPGRSLKKKGGVLCQPLGSVNSNGLREENKGCSWRVWKTLGRNGEARPIWFAQEAGGT